jgi:hypothetical protein
MRFLFEARCCEFAFQLAASRKDFREFVFPAVRYFGAASFHSTFAFRFARFGFHADFKIFAGFWGGAVGLCVR